MALTKVNDLVAVDEELVECGDCMINHYGVHIVVVRICNQHIDRNDL